MENSGCFKVFIFIFILMVIFIFIDALDNYFKANNTALWVISAIGIIGFIWHQNIKNKATNEKEGAEDKQNDNIGQEEQLIINIPLDMKVISLEEFLNNRDLKVNQIAIGIENELYVLMANNKAVALIDKKLWGSNIDETIKNITSVNLVFKLYSDTTKLPCCMESESQWEEVALF